MTSVKTEFQIRSADLKGVFIGFDAEWEAMRWWQENVPAATGMHKGAVVVKATWETPCEAETARLDWLDQHGQPETYEDASHALVWVVHGEPGGRSVRAAIDAARGVPERTETVIYPKP